MKKIAIPTEIAIIATFMKQDPGQSVAISACQYFYFINNMRYMKNIEFLIMINITKILPILEK